MVLFTEHALLPVVFLVYFTRQDIRHGELLSDGVDHLRASRGSDQLEYRNLYDDVYRCGVVGVHRVLHERIRFMKN